MGLIIKIVVLILGVMAGINIATDRPILSNPFNDVEIQEKTKKATGQLIGEVSKQLGVDENLKELSSDFVEKEKQRLKENIEKNAADYR